MGSQRRRDRAQVDPAQEKLGTGSYKTVSLASLKSRSALRTLRFGKVYRYRVRATDVVGNVSAWTTSPPFVISRAQETSAAIVYTGPWGRAASTSYSGGRARGRGRPEPARR